MRKLLHPMRYLRRRAVYSGLFGGNRRWLVIGGTAWVLHFVGRIFGFGEPEPLYTKELEPGERFVVIHNPPPPRRRRRRRRDH